MRWSLKSDSAHPMCTLPWGGESRVRFRNNENSIQLPEVSALEPRTYNQPISLQQPTFFISHVISVCNELSALEQWQLQVVKGCCQLLVGVLLLFSLRQAPVRTLELQLLKESLLTAPTATGQPLKYQLMSSIYLCGFAPSWPSVRIIDEYSLKLVPFPHVSNNIPVFLTAQVCFTKY